MWLETMMCILQGLEKCKVNSEHLAALFNSYLSATAPPKPVKKKQAKLVKQELWRKWMILQLSNK